MTAIRVRIVIWKHLIRTKSYNDPATIRKLGRQLYRYSLICPSFNPHL